MTGKRRLIIAGGVVAAALFDLTAATVLLLPQQLSSTEWGVVFVTGVHGACAAAAGVLLARLAPPFVRHTARHVAMFSGCFAFFVPVLGPLGVLAVLLGGLTEPRPSTCEPWLSHEPPRGVDELRRRTRGPGRQASAVEIGHALRHRSTESAGARFRAVLATRHLPASVAVRLLRIAQSDPFDEVRLYAFSRLEQMRREIEQRIERLTAAALAAAEEDAPRIQLRLAESHWELADSGLTEGAVREHALKCAHRHAAAACELAPGHAAAQFFLGKVLLALRDSKNAKMAFDRAARAGYPRKKLLPRLAECAFLRRDYLAVRALLQELDASPHESAEFRPLIELWTRDESARVPSTRAPMRVEHVDRTERAERTEQLS
ncbi:MAG TPA: hypothetical protein VM580_17810 [Labilithrix sp.]|nr:hypothetical protein [Labilithrix sp.]